MGCLRFRGGFAGEEGFLQQISGENCAWQDFTLRPTPWAFVGPVPLFLSSAARPQVGEIIVAQIINADCVELTGRHTSVGKQPDVRIQCDTFRVGRAFVREQPIADAEQVVSFGKPIEQRTIR